MDVLTVGPLNGDLGQLAQAMQAHGANLLHVDNARAASALLSIAPEVGLVVVKLPHDINSLVRLLAGKSMSRPILACSRNAADKVQAIADGAQEFLLLPPDARAVASLLRSRPAISRGLVAHDPAMLAIIQRAERFASTDATVLITGASGTGKENIARHVHGCSRRARMPFVALNCAAIPENLLESELFGHERGAFSGAVTRKIGKFEAADGGTLLLDEISEMDLRLQAKLLRVIQERELDRVGGSAPVPVNVRVLATSNRDFSVEMAAGRFRADLFFRLNVIGLHIPALCERQADIPALSDYYARHYARVNGLSYRPLSDAALQLFMAHPWPGNVRELENTVHRAVLLASGSEIGLDAIELPRERERAAVPAAGVAALVGRTVDDVEQDLILHTLTHTAGNRTHAAHILGISIRALRNKLRDYAQAGAAEVLHAA